MTNQLYGEIELDYIPNYPLTELETIKGQLTCYCDKFVINLNCEDFLLSSKYLKKIFSTFKLLLWSQSCRTMVSRILCLIPDNIFLNLIRPFLAQILNNLDSAKLYLKLIMTCPYLEDLCPQITINTKYIIALKAALILKNDPLEFIKKRPKYFIDNDFKPIIKYLDGIEICPSIKTYISNYLPLAFIKANDYWSFSFIKSKGYLITNKDFFRYLERNHYEIESKLARNLFTCPNIDYKTFRSFEIFLTENNPSEVNGTIFKTKISQQDEFETTVSITGILANKVQPDLDRIALTIVHDYFSTKLLKLNKSLKMNI